MLRVLWWTIEITAIIVAAYWLFDHPGNVNASWNDYTMETSTGIVFLLFVLALVLVNSFRGIVRFLLNLPQYWKSMSQKKKRDRGYKSLTLGLTAVSAGDKALSSYHAYRMRRFIPDEEGLPWLLEAQAARLRGDETEARGFFEKLLKNKDTSFLGVRGLLQASIESADLDKAIEMARQAMAMHPGQAWIVRTLYGLEIQKHEWAAALTTLKKAERAKAFPAEEITSNRIAILLQQADELKRAGYPAEALKKMREALRFDPVYIPTVVRISNAYRDVQKRRAAVAVVERAWKENPHPDLVPVWASLAPPNKPSDMAVRLRWFEKLVALNPSNAESQMAAAKAAFDDGLWGEAWQYLAAAEKIKPSAQLYRLWAQMEEKTGHSESAKRYWEKAADAEAGKVWICRDTGTIYESWSPLAEPHGAFNTIVWDSPRPIRTESFVLGTAGNDLIVEPVKQINART